MRHHFMRLAFPVVYELRHKSIEDNAREINEMLMLGTYENTETRAVHVLSLLQFQKQKTVLSRKRTKQNLPEKRANNLFAGPKICSNGARMCKLFHRSWKGYDLWTLAEC